MFFAIAVLLAAATELCTRYIIDPGSAIQRRVEGERAEAVALRPEEAGQPRSVLLVGNSLLLHSVDMGLLNQRLAPYAQVRRFVVESTFYWDWYFGLQRLFDEGCRPDRVIVVLAPGQILSNEIRNDYFAHYLMRGRDVVPVASAAGLHPTVASQLVVSRFSLFYGIRNEVRKHVLSSLLPGLEGFASMLTAHAARPAPPPGAEDEIRRRVNALFQLGAQRSIPVAVLVPPSGTSPAVSGYDPIVARLAAESASFLVAMPSSETNPGDYFDGFHTNAAGRERHTLRLAEALRAGVRR